MITPPIIKESGEGERFICVVSCMHGNEVRGAEATEMLWERNFGIRVRWIIANVDARKVMRRYIESDLNRSFPGKEDGTYEERLALLIAKAVEGAECVLDLHTTTAATSPFVIITRRSEEIENIANAVPIEKLVHIPAALSKGKALIDMFPGVAIECDERTSAEEVMSWIVAFLENWREDTRTTHEEYEGTGLLMGNDVLENFSHVAEGTLIDDKPVEKGFYPVLSGEVAYKGISAIMCRKK
jgi:hypothetical protein